MDLLTALQSGQIADRKRLNLSYELTEFPTEILAFADSLEVLDLSNNHLSTLPNEFRQLKNLKTVFFTNNQFEVIPKILADCPNLSMISFKGNRIKKIDDNVLSPIIRWLILTNNQIESLPEDIGNLNNLQKLMLAGNRLTTLPQTLEKCQKLELIRISENRLSALPNCLFKLPRLSWLAYSGNPCSYKRNDSDEIPDIFWPDVTQGEVLGQGASGVIYQGTWTPAVSEARPQNVSSQAVAIKLFKGSMTSDGSPMDEMQTCIAAGQHPHLVTALGKLVNVPEGQAGLVFPLITSEYQNLGNPPSLDSCTRDTYNEGTTFTTSIVVAIAHDIASAVAHLHTKGIMHGDLYAHNILVNTKGNSILGDFGAASFYDPSDTTMAQRLECLEVRAFGYLLEDLLNHHELSSPSHEKTQDFHASSGQGRSPNHKALNHDRQHQNNQYSSDQSLSKPEHGKKEQTVISILRQLQHDCLQMNPLARPTFQDICAILEKIIPKSD